MMRIALILECLDPRRGGCEVYTAAVAQDLIARGHDVTVVCHDSPWRCEGLRVLRVPRGGWSRVGQVRRFALGVRDMLRDERFDIAHAMVPVVGANVYQPHSGTMPARRAASLRRRFGVFRLSADITGRFNVYRGYLARRERELVADPNVLCLCVSDSVAEQFREHFGRTEGVRVIFNGVDVPTVSDAARARWRAARRAELGVGEDATVFLTVAGNFHLKGVGAAIESFAAWSRQGGPGRDGRLVIIGRDRHSRCGRAAARCGVAGRVRVVPWTDRPFEWYSAADANVLLSWYDSCSLVILEGTRWGLPSITTRYNGAASILRSGGGIVVDGPLDRSAVVRAMEELSDPTARRARSAACLAAGGELTVGRHVDGLIEAYKEVNRRHG